jgi:RNA polymerase sigma-70 factor (ECF subfamily)
VTSDTVYADLRPLMFSLAYRMVGSVTEAEDIVQEAFLRYYRAGRDGAEVEAPRAYLATVTTRLAIDTLRSARARRESYFGPWLPEPLVADPNADPAHRAEMNETLSIALLVVLETLTPTERAVYVLREAFGYEYPEIARIVGRSVDNCRQLVVRARRHVEERRPRFAVDRQQHVEVARRFFAACATGDAKELAALLADDVTIYGDGGGRATATAAPVVGALRVGRFLAGLVHQAARWGIEMTEVLVNGEPGLLARDADRRVVSVLALEIDGDRVTAIYSMVNPDKLGHLGPTSDVALRSPDALRKR